MNEPLLRTFAILVEMNEWIDVCVCGVSNNIYIIVSFESIHLYGSFSSSFFFFIYDRRSIYDGQKVDVFNYRTTQ